MKKYVCKYVVLRFAPYSETGEFANVGVLLYSQNHNAFVFKLDTTDLGGRVTKFFHINDKQILKFAMSSYKEELVFMKERVTQHQLTAHDAFELLVKPRATLLRFSEPRTVITDSIDATLNSVFDRMVSHSSASQTRARLKLSGMLRDQLASLRLANPFKRHKFVKSGFETTYDFTQLNDDGNPLKLIQPIELMDRTTPKNIYDVVDRSESRLNRMNNLDLLPQKVLLPFSIEKNRSKEIDEVWSIVKKELQQFGELVDIQDHAAIAHFAQN